MICGVFGKGRVRRGDLIKYVLNGKLDTSFTVSSIFFSWIFGKTSYQFQREARAHLLILSAGEDASEVRPVALYPRGVASLGRAGASDASFLLLPGFGREGGEQGRGFGLGVFFEVGVCEELGGGRASGGIQREEGAEEIGAGGGEEGEFGANDGADTGNGEDM